MHLILSTPLAKLMLRGKVLFMLEKSLIFPRLRTSFFGYIFYRNLIPVILFSKTLLALGSLHILEKKVPGILNVSEVFISRIFSETSMSSIQSSLKSHVLCISQDLIKLKI